VTGVVASNISDEATSWPGNIFAEAMRGRVRRTRRMEKSSATLGRKNKGTARRTEVSIAPSRVAA